MAEFEGIKINAEAIKSTGSTSQSNLTKNDIKFINKLLCQNIDRGSINTRIARGKSEIKILSDYTPKNLENLNNNIDTFQSNVSKISKPLQNCSSIAEQGNNLILDSTAAVKENGDLIGLAISTSQSQSDSNSTEAIMSDSASSVSSPLNQRLQTESNSIFGNNASGDNFDKFSSGEEDPDGKQIYSCDWGNGAKTVEEIKSANQNSKSNKGLFGFINNGNSVELNNINASNSKIKNQIETIKKQKNDGLAKSSNSSSKKEELTDRVMTDLQGVKIANAKNLSEFSNEKGYSSKVNDNIKTGNKYLDYAKIFNKTEKTLANESIENLHMGVEHNSKASEILGVSRDIIAATLYADTASIYNWTAGMLTGIVKKSELRSIESQNSALQLVKESINTIIPEYKESAQNRIAENKKSLDRQKETKALIKNEYNLAFSEDLSFDVNSLNNQEKALVSKFNQNKIRIDELNSDNDKFNEGNFENDKKDFII